ncbi:MAG: 1-deoxy-D-xylulose-5-phosphate reductoisomerase, partial [Clostridia bacterium]|nr:1-deoxy-D-xylulose-5-phosphate reductoisomerase [Clostridia bacterium]
AAKGGNMPVIYNAANEYLVSRFLNRKIGFLDIPKYINESIEHFQYVENPTVKEIIDMETAVYEYLGSRC